MAVIHSYVPTCVVHLGACSFLGNLYDLYSFNHLVPLVILIPLGHDYHLKEFFSFCCRIFLVCYSIAKYELKFASIVFCLSVNYLTDRQKTISPLNKSITCKYTFLSNIILMI